MSSELPSRQTPPGDEKCPVCRARQPLSMQCRRCKADLELVYRARRRLEYLAGQPQTERILAERRLLSPNS